MMSPVFTWLARSCTHVRRVKRNVLMFMSRGDRQAMTDAILPPPSSACEAATYSVQALVRGANGGGAHHGKRLAAERD
eukprot:scaffold45505_cov61-Phaeocystis_antarctica.AAC.3